MNRAGDMTRTAMCGALVKQTGLKSLTVTKALKTTPSNYQCLAYVMKVKGGDVVRSGVVLPEQVATGASIKACGTVGSAKLVERMSRTYAAISARTPSATNCTASAASMTPSRRVRIERPVSPRIRSTRSASRKTM